VENPARGGRFSTPRSLTLQFVENPAGLLEFSTFCGLGGCPRGLAVVKKIRTRAPVAGRG
jgi:hypothetical protein